MEESVAKIICYACRTYVRILNESQPVITEILFAVVGPDV